MEEEKTMRRTRGGLRPALIALAAIGMLAFASPAAAAKRHDAFPLHPHSAGPNVAALQWLLGSHKPNVFSQVKGTFKRKPNGEFGARTTAALTAYRYRIGFPRKRQCGARTNLVASTTVTGYFFNLLKGRAKRPACWVALAAARVKAINVGPTKAAVRIRGYELTLLGIEEQPDGSNRGPCISVSCSRTVALQSATGAYGEAWCVSTQQTVLKTLGYGTFADDTAGVYYAVDYAAARNWLSAKAKVGALVAFIDYDSRGVRIPGTGHMGFVVAVQATSFTYVAGNDGNAVREHTIGDGSRPYAFIYLPGIA